MNDLLVAGVRRRAINRCEYCRMPQEADPFPFQIDHIIPVFHRGPTALSNLALSCWACNAYKGSNIAGVDPRTAKIVRLFHPRLHQWNYHFAYRAEILRGKTAIGRVTVETLRINLPERGMARSALIEEGVRF